MEFVQRLDLRLELEVGCEVEFDFQRIVLVFGIRQDLDMRGDVGSSQHANSKLPYEGPCDLAFVDFWLRDLDTRTNPFEGSFDDLLRQADAVVNNGQFCELWMTAVDLDFFGIGVEGVADKFLERASRSPVNARTDVLDDFQSDVDVERLLPLLRHGSVTTRRRLSQRLPVWTFLHPALQGS